MGRPQRIRRTGGRRYTPSSRPLRTYLSSAPLLPHTNTPLYYRNMPRGRHPKKEIEAALRDAEAQGWRVVIAATAHRWGVMTCPEQSRAGCRASIWSTPRNAGNHARQIRHVLHRCPHAGIKE